MCHVLFLTDSIKHTAGVTVDILLERESKMVITPEFYFQGQILHSFGTNQSSLALEHLELIFVLS